MNPFQYHVPRSLPEVFELLIEHGEEAKLLAGGTALLIMMRLQLVRPAHVVNLAGIRGLSGMAEGDGGLRIGPLTTLRELESASAIRKCFPVLSQTLRTLATVRIRNVATIGGGLAHGDPALDLPVTLMALDASVRLAQKVGERVVPLDEFFCDYYETVMRPEEVLTEVCVPFLPAHTAAHFIKFLPRTADDYATVSVATRLRLDESRQVCEDVRIALGACGPTPLRARRAEAVLRGRPASEEAFKESASVARTEVDPISDIRGSAAYKADMVEVFVRRALEATHGRLIGGT